MTEERFIKRSVCDGQIECTYVYDNGNQISVNEVVDLLNELSEENEQLKQRIKELELLNDGLNYTLQNIRKIDVEIDVRDKND